MIGRFVARALTGLVRGYQLVVSPWFAPTCRYYPSCSQYAINALQQHGPIKGLIMAIWRVLRCNPWSEGGVDHVPDVWPTRSGDETTHRSAEDPAHGTHPAPVHTTWRTLHGNL